MLGMNETGGVKLIHHHSLITEIPVGVILSWKVDEIFSYISK